MYRRIQTEYRAPSIRITRHNEHESLRSSSESSKPVIDKSRQGLFSRFPRSRTFPRRIWTSIDEGGNEKQREIILRAGTSSFNETVAYGRPSTMTNHHRSRCDNARRLHPSTPARFSRFAAFLGGKKGGKRRGEESSRGAMPRKMYISLAGLAMKCRTRGSSDARNRCEGEGERGRGHDSTGWPLERVAPVNRRRVV